MLYVAPGGNCNGANPCYGSVQAAVDAATPSDEIRVATGPYTDVNMRPRNDMLYFRHSAATLSGNTVQNNAANTVGAGYGGGLYINRSDNATPTPI